MSKAVQPRTLSPSLMPVAPGSTIDPLQAPDTDVIALCTIPTNSESHERCILETLTPSILVKHGPAESMINEHANHYYASVVFEGAEQVKVPCIMQFFVYAGRGYLLMQRVRGKTLDTILSQGGSRCESYISLIQAAIERMQNFRSPIPGPTGGGKVSGWPMGATEGGERWMSVGELEDSINARLKKKVVLKDNPLVFTHRRLSPGNIMLMREESGHVKEVYILDWQIAGFYPAIFETGAMKRGALASLMTAKGENARYWGLMLDWLKTRPGHDSLLLQYLESKPCDSGSRSSLDSEESM